MTPEPELASLKYTRGEDPFFARPVLIVAVALVASLFKIGIALATLGTNDVIAFYQFAKAIEIHGLTWTYEHSILFNHPPLVGYFLQGLAWLGHQPFFRQNDLTFPFLLRLPGIIADFGVVLLVLSVVREYPNLRPPRWAMLLFAASPVSIMVSGFHGNTDPILVLFLVLAAVMALRDRPFLCGLFLALSCQVKIIPLLLLPIFLFFWLERRRLRSFLGSFLLSSLLFCAEPLLRSPVAFVKNVLSYGSFWGIWGLTYCLRITGIHEFNKVSFFNLSGTQDAIIMILKITVVLSVLLLAWRRRKLSPPALFASVGYAWMIFFVLSPAVAAQYLVWLGPFILLLSPTFYGFLVAGSSIFLFFFYNITSGGFPWYFAHASDKLNAICAQWALIPWLTLAGGLFAFVLSARRQNPNLRFLSLTPIEPQKGLVSNETKLSPPDGHRRLFFIAIALVSLAGIALRIYPSSTFNAIGYDEGLYRGYVNTLITSGLTSYPDVAESYVELQTRLPAAILPPTRFLYIFSAYLWHQVTGEEALVALHRVSCLFSILLLFAAGAFAWRLGGPRIALAVLALMACAPTQIHMSQHALIDGFFAFWAILSLWFLWENLRQPNDPRWLILYATSLALMVVTKENAVFAYAGLLALIGANRWLRFGTVTRPLLLVTIAGPLLGVVVLIALCGSATTFFNTYRLLVAKASVLPYAIATGDGPWYRYLLELLLVSPLVFLLAWGAIFRLKPGNKEPLFLIVFVSATYLVMCNVRYGMNLRYTNMWDMPLRYLAVVCLCDVTQSLRRQATAIVLAVILLAAFDLRQYHIFFVKYGLYELVTGGLLRAVQILK